MAHASRIIKWGIVGAGRISSDFAQCLHYAPNAELVAVGSRSLSLAQEFAKEHNVPVSYGSYEDLVGDKNVEVVYVGTPHVSHKELTLLAFKHGKHVLCEKPAGMNKKEVEEMVKAARAANLFFMEATWTRCFPIIKKVRSLIADGVIGEPKTLLCDFGFRLAGPNERLTERALGGGATLDIGIYPVTFAFMVFGQKPTKIQAMGSLLPTGADNNVAIHLGFKSDQFASLFCTFAVNTPRKATVLGTKGSIVVDYPFWCSTSCTVTFDDTTKAPLKFTEPLPTSEKFKKFYHSNSEGLAYEAIHVGECISEGLKESPFLPLDESLQIADVLDEIRRQIGVVYDADK